MARHHGSYPKCDICIVVGMLAQASAFNSAVLGHTLCVLELTYVDVVVDGVALVGAFVLEEQGSLSSSVNGSKVKL